VAAISGSDPSLGLHGLVHKVISINVYESSEEVVVRHPTSTTMTSSTTSTTTTTDAVEIPTSTDSSVGIAVAIVVSVLSFLSWALCGIYYRVAFKKKYGGGEQQPTAGAADHGAVAAPDVEVESFAGEQVQVIFTGALVEITVGEDMQLDFTGGSSDEEDVVIWV